MVVMMTRAAKGRGWKLALGILLALVVGEVGREIVLGMEKPPAPAKKAEPTHTYDPAFHKGDPAPDFTLPDRDGKPHRLSQLVRRDTLLFFTCGCTRNGTR